MFYFFVKVEFNGLYLYSFEILQFNSLLIIVIVNINQILKYLLIII